MSTQPASRVVSAQREQKFARRINATWWYTVSAVLLWQVPVVVFWVTNLLDSNSSVVPGIVVGVCGIVWIAASAPLVLDYRHRGTDAPHLRRPRLLLALTLSLVCGASVWLVSDFWVLSAVPVLQTLVVMHWPRGVRLRVVLAVTLLLIALWIVDTRMYYSRLTGDDATAWWLLGLFTIATPPATVLSLWWWDVFISLNRARAAEARLAATQERLRVAIDVHDLQGHHLQVIALQLELSERLMADDPEASLMHLRVASDSVDAARQETRELATPFRSVDLSDEIANAVDLLRAAGATVDASYPPDADHAPADVFGPVVRETTTNVLRHGSGDWARLRLRRVTRGWRYEISNGRTDCAEDPLGSGLQGIGHRVGEAGGSIEVRRGQDDFVVVVTVTDGGGP